MRKQLRVSFVFCLTILVLCQYRAGAQDLAYLGPMPLKQRDESRVKALDFVLRSLEKKFNVFFTFESEVVQHKYVRNEVVITEDLEETLRHLLKPFHLQFRKISTQYYTIYPAEEARPDSRNVKKNDRAERKDFAPREYYMGFMKVVASPDFQFIVSGAVSDENSQPLPGVNVIEKGTTNGTTSDAAGAFTLHVENERSVLVFSFIGYTSMEVPVNGRSTINISLAPSVQSLQEVVVVGYGTVERKDLTGAVGSVDSKDIRDLAVTRIDQALLGKVAGVQVKPISGEPGASPQIRIRGIGSISAGSDPLYVVDGFPTDNIETLNPNDVESIDILKDASATAIYGSRGSNGVVIINTKRGKTGKPMVTYDTFYGWQQVSKIPDFMNAREQAEFAYYAVLNRNLDLGNDVSGPPDTWGFPMPQTVMDVREGRSSVDVNHIKEVLHTAPQLQHQLGVTGGNENIKYAVTGGYMNQEGIILNSGFERYSFRSNLDVKVSDKFNVKINFNPYYTHQSGHDPRGTGYGYSVLGNAASLNPYNPVYDENGDYFIYEGLPEVGNFPNPVALAKEVISERKRMGIIGNINAEYAILDELKFGILLGENFSNRKGMEFFPKLPSLLEANALGTDEASMNYNWLTEYTLNYNKGFGHHNVAALAGYTVQKERGESNYMSSNQFSNNLVPTLSATGGLINNGTSDVYEWSLISYLGRVNYNYDNKYYLTASLRTDGSSRFGSERKYGLFPSLALAWRMSDEQFMKGLGFLSELKLRASYGETGNNNIGNYEHLSTIDNVLYPVGDSPVTGFTPGRLPNPSLTWEKQRSINLGLDAGLFNGRLLLTVDHFNSNNTDLLLRVNVPEIAGFGSALTNIGEVKNTGWEFILSTVNLTKAFQWSTDFNLSTYRNEVVRLGPKGDPIISSTHITMIGEPIGMFYGVLTDGIFETQAELDAGPLYAPGSSAGTHLGDIKFVDLSGPDGKPDGIIDSYDRTIMGSAYPDFYYGMTNNFSFKNFSLSVSLQGMKGNKIMSEAKRVSMRGEFRVNQLAVLDNFWKSEQDPGDSPRPNDEPTGGVRQVSDRFLDEGTYLRINNIAFSYLVPNAFAQKIKLKSLRIYVNSTNPFLFTKNLGFNPDVSNSNDALRPGVDNNLYPLAKNILLGLNASF